MTVAYQSGMIRSTATPLAPSPNNSTALRVAGASSFLKQPPHWSDVKSEAQGPNVQMHICSSVPAGTTHYYEGWLVADLSRNEVASKTLAGSVGAAWRSAGSELSNVKGLAKDIEGLTDDPQNTVPAISDFHIKLHFYSPGYYTPGSVMGYCFETSFDRTYNSPTPLVYDVYDLTCRSTYRVYNKQRPCSAYQFKKLICGNNNVLTYNSKQFWSVPV